MNLYDLNSEVMYTCISREIKSQEKKKKAHKPLSVKYDITVDKYYAEDFFPIALKLDGKLEKANNHSRAKEVLVRNLQSLINFLHISKETA